MDLAIEWLLLLPILFALGWMAAKFDARRHIQEARELPEHYFASLKHLVDGQPDAAIDALIEVARHDTGSVNLYSALGHLFAQRGEIAGATRMYQSLLQRPDLSAADRVDVTYKLGDVFLRGGLFDRAQHCFMQLTDGPKAAAAHNQLLQLAQSQQEWQQAITLTEQMSAAAASPPTSNSNSGNSNSGNNSSASNHKHRIAQAHFHCELAQDALKAGDSAAAQQHLQAAQRIHPEGVRAAMIAAQALHAQGEPAQALAAWQQLIAAQPQSIALCIRPMMESYRAVDASNAQVFLDDIALSSGSMDVLDVWLESGDMSPARIKQLQAIFQAHPSLNAMLRLLQQQAQSDGQDALSKQYAELIARQAREGARYHCNHCGFAASHYYWQCPACTHWETYPAQRSEEVQRSARHVTQSYY